VFHLVVGNDELRLRGKILEDRGLDGRFDGTPGSNKRLKIYSREGWFGANLARLTDLVEISPEVMEEQMMTGHEDLS